jgi:hypothetical protein
MKENLLRLISELTGKINPPMWTVFFRAFYSALKEGKNYDEAKVIGQKQVDLITVQIGSEPYVPNSNSDYSMTGIPLLPNFGNQQSNALLLSQLNSYHILRFKKVQKELTVTQREIALRWDDSKITPPGHLLSIVLHNTDDLNLIEKVIIGLNEAAVACWALKYAIKQGRPEEMILALYNEVFVPLIATPRHPSCPSGHSTFSGVVAEICKNLKNIIDPITNLTYSDFNAIAEEASISRVYGGIHYHKDCDFGMKLGRAIGKRLAA